MKGRFNLKYFIKGSGGLEDWFKSWGLGWRLIVTVLVVLFVTITIYRAYFMKTQTQKQTANIIALPMSHITYAPVQSQKQEVKKRPWWLPFVFGEIYGFSETANIGNQRIGIGSRGGLRWEW